MIVDFLHDFYTMPINIVIGGVPTQTTIRWYKAPAGAKFLPFPSAIFTHVWDNNPGESVPGEIGEVGYPRTWDPGRNPGYQGQCYRGDPSWFQTGQLPPLNTIAPSACLCQIPPAIAGGGLVLGGAASASVVPDCQPRTGFLHRNFVAPGPVTGTFTNIGGSPTIYRLADPVNPFFWFVSSNLVPCHGFPESTLVWASVNSTGSPHLFNLTCLAWDGALTGNWITPATAPFYPNQVFYLFSN